MPPTWDKVVALASVRLYGAAEGYPVVTDHGYKVYSTLAQEWPQGTITFSGGAPTLEFLAGVGLVNRPYLNLMDTRLIHYLRSGGKWEERRPATRAPRRYRLVQYNAAPNIVWSATSGFALPAAPHFAFSLAIFNTPADHDEVTYPAYVRVEFGGDPPQWALEFHNVFGARVMRRVDGAWLPWQELPTPLTPNNQPGEEFVVLVRHYRGAMFVSTDYARTYVRIANPDGSPLAVPAGALVVRGQGSALVFGLHQLAYAAGTFTQLLRQTFTPRAAAVPVITPRGDSPGMSSITLADNGDPPNGLAGWTATMTPSTSGTFPWAFHYGPELYSVAYRIPVTTGGGGLDYETPWDDAILAVEYQAPVDLAGARATIYVLKDAAVQFTGDYKWRRVDIRLGWLKDDTTEEWFDTFTGHIARIGVEQRMFGQAVIPIEVENTTIRAKTAEWSELNCEPLGGLLVNEALDVCLVVLGLGAGFRAWDVAGNFVALPPGAPEDPFLYPQPGDNVWETMRGLAAHAKLEIGARADGVFYTQPIGYVSGTLDHTWDAAPTDDAERTVQEAAFSFNSADNVTCIVARGKDEWGNTLMAFGVDTPAELDTASGRFSEWRMTHREDVPGTCTLGMLIGLVQGRFLDVVRPRYNADITSPVRLDVERRQRVEVHGTTVGIDDADQFAVMAVSIRFTNEGGGAALAMTAGLERVAPL